MDWKVGILYGGWAIFAQYWFSAQFINEQYYWLSETGDAPVGAVSTCPHSMVPGSPNFWTQ